MVISASLLSVGVAAIVVDEEKMLLKKGSNISLEYVPLKPGLVALRADWRSVGV